MLMAPQGAGMLALGLNWWHTILATLVGHIVAAGLVVLVSYPGLEYHISFPVASRIGWGESIVPYRSVSLFL